MLIRTQIYSPSVTRILINSFILFADHISQSFPIAKMRCTMQVLIESK